MMNKAILMGRLTRNPEIRYSQGEKPVCIARYTLAVNRRFHRDGQPEADFISCLALGRQGEFAEKYFKQGMKVVICGRIQTGNYTDKDNQKRYFTEVLVEEQDFAESKNASASNNATSTKNTSTAPSPTNAAGPNSDGFMTIPDGIEEELPFI